MRNIKKISHIQYVTYCLHIYSKVVKEKIVNDVSKQFHYIFK